MPTRLTGLVNRMAERTPRPWEVQPEDDFGFVVSHPGEGDTATFVARTITHANAEAIAALPEMVAFLECLDKRYRPIPAYMRYEWVDDLLALMDKVRGVSE